jgi:hypothetical protein
MRKFFRILEKIPYPCSQTGRWQAGTKEHKESFFKKESPEHPGLTNLIRMKVIKTE